MPLPLRMRCGGQNAKYQKHNDPLQQSVTAHAVPTPVAIVGNDRGAARQTMGAGKEIDITFPADLPDPG